MTVYLLDYGAGNVRSLVNAVCKLGYSIRPVESVEDIEKADKLIFPGVGAYGAAMQRLSTTGYDVALKKYIASGKPFMGICVGMQVLFDGSEESPGVSGLGVFPATVKRFDASTKAVPHMGWNSAVEQQQDEDADEGRPSNASWINHEGRDSKYYFVHSYAVPATDQDWEFSTTQYGSERFVSAVRQRNVFATQFHPEKSGWTGLKVLRSFLECSSDVVPRTRRLSSPRPTVDGLTKRIIACLDVRANDAGDLVVTKGDQYDVRDRTDPTVGTGEVRNLGKPVQLARTYFEMGADEITFLNITAFRNVPLSDLPMLEVLERTSESVFVPLTIGGGIRDIVQPDGTSVPALEVAGAYFRSGADKVSIGSDAVYAAEQYIANGGTATGLTAIEQIARVYGSQAVVVSVDPRRVYVASPSLASTHNVIRTRTPGPDDERFCWYECTVKGGREARDLDVVQLVVAVAALGAGEILLNCMDRDGTNSGFDHELVDQVRAAVTIPVIASSGAGNVEHFEDVFRETGVEAALAAGIFHRGEVPIGDVKTYLAERRYKIRPLEPAL
ncbi:Histidine biosynthesis bifunctional protein hisB [Thoreauomyces humboldtii]|nr:Histidine biosynthesis bifunctional protein hisB [Thoreauomyces humboldtii]